MRLHTGSGGDSGLVEVVIAVVVMALLCFAVKYVWQGVVWALEQYIQLLRVQ